MPGVAALSAGWSPRRATATCGIRRRTSARSPMYRCFLAPTRSVPWLCSGRSAHGL